MKSIRHKARRTQEAVAVAEYSAGGQLQDIADLLGHFKLGTAAIYTQTALDQRLLKAYRMAFA